MTQAEPLAADPIERRAKELFDDHQEGIFRRTDRLFARLMLFQWLLGIVFALWISPRTWEGTLSRTHIHVWAAVLLGGAIAALPVLFAAKQPGAASTRHVIAVGQMLTSALLIHLTGGRIETHFHVFGSLAFLAMYRDWRVLMTASVVVFVDHFARGLYWPQSVYGVLSATPWRAVEHAAWVLFEDVVLVGSCHHSLREMWEISQRQASLEAVKASVEGQVRKRTAELQASEQRFRALVEKSSDGIFLVGTAGTILYASESAFRILGYSRDELQGRNGFDLVHPEELEYTSARFQECLENPAREIRATYRLQHKDGSWRHIEGVGVNRLDDPAVGAIVVNFRDLTERRRVEEALEEQRVLLRQVIDTDPNFVFVKDRQGRFTMVNQSVADAYGTTVEGLVGKTDADFNPSHEEVEWFRRDDLEVMDSRREKLIPEEVITEASGKQRWLQTVKRPLYGPDGVASHILGVSTDITERKRAEEALRQSQKMEAVGRLAGGIAHDFNNLLNVIIGYSELLHSNLAAGDRQHARVDQIRKASDRAAALTRQLLTFTRKQVLQPQVLELNAVVADMDKMLRRLIGEDVDLRTALCDEPGLVKADPGQLQQVIMNLVVNARDAMPEGGRLTIETANVHLDDGGAHASASVGTRPFAMLAVTDTGVGMAPEVRARVFEPYFTTKEQGKGTGLGLATVYGIVQQSAGQIGVYSEPGNGTTFKIYLPQAEGDAERARARVEASAPPRGTETILLVEDEHAVRALAREVLEASGYTVIEARSGDEALHVCAQTSSSIQLLLTDVVMPGLNGPQVAQRLVLMRPGMRILYMSGYAEGALLHQSVVEAGVRLLQKPFSPNQLIWTVRQVLDSVAEPGSQSREDRSSPRTVARTA